MNIGSENNYRRIHVRNDDSSGFSEQRKSIEPEFDQRSFPRGHRYNGKQKFEKDFYVWMLFMLSYTPDKHSLYSTIALYNKMNHTHFDEFLLMFNWRIDFSLASRLSVFKQLNVAVGHFSNNSHQCHTGLCFVWHVFVLTTFVSSTKMWKTWNYELLLSALAINKFLTSFPKIYKL